MEVAVHAPFHNFLKCYAEIMHFCAKFILCYKMPPVNNGGRPPLRAPSPPTLNPPLTIISRKCRRLTFLNISSHSETEVENKLGRYCQLRQW